jgi:hypothetical protein
MALSDMKDRFRYLLGLCATDRALGELPDIIDELGGGGGSSSVLPQKIVQRIADEDDYNLTTDDLGKHLFVISDLTLRVPPDDVTDFEIGTIITIVSGQEDITVYPMEVDGGGAGILCVGIGITDASLWAVPSLSMATLMKVGPNVWYLSGPGISDDS